MMIEPIEGPVSWSRDSLPDCLMCAVRQLTEGDPRLWTTNQPGDSVTGVVLRTPTVNSLGGVVPAVDLWLGGDQRIRVAGIPVTLRNGIAAADPRVGDRMMVRYLGRKMARSYRGGTRPYQDFEVLVERGHH